MKKFLVLAASLLLFTGCNFARIEGNGTIVSKKINTVKNISELEASGAFTLIVKIADTTSIEITTDANLLKYVGMKISGDKLKIYTKESIRPTDKIAISITTPHLTNVDLSGANELRVEGLDEDELNVECSGASTLILEGEVKKFTADVSGTANLNSVKLIAENVRIDISGAADAQVYAKKFLRVSASGAAEIEYAGTPELVNVDASGAASVTKITEK